MFISWPRTGYLALFSGSPAWYVDQYLVSSADYPGSEGTVVSRVCMFMRRKFEIAGNVLTLSWLERFGFLP